MDSRSNALELLTKLESSDEKEVVVSEAMYWTLRNLGMPLFSPAKGHPLGFNGIKISVEETE